MSSASAFTIEVPGIRLASGRAVGLRLAMTREGPHDGPAWLLLHGISGSHFALAAHAGLAADGGWAATWAGPGCLLDTRTQQVLTVNAPGGCHGSSWPDPVDGAHAADPRAISDPADHVPIDEAGRAIVAALDRLGIARLAGIIGYSFGGYLAGRLMQDAPQRAGRALLVCSDRVGRGGIADLLHRADLQTAEGRAAWRMQTLLQHGLAEWIADHGPAAAATETRRVDRWARECDARNLLRLRAAAAGHRLDALPAGCHRLLARSDRMFPPPASADPAVSVVETPYGHQSLILDPAAWHAPLAAWLHTR